MILKQAFLRAATAALPKQSVDTKPLEPSLVGLQYFVKTRRWEKPASHYEAVSSPIATTNPFAQVMYGIPPQESNSKKAFWESLMQPTAEVVVIDGELVE
ncbi:MAG: hypothetical protein QE263_05585 [Vampirovibrionales bacterium]|nr:hypothetical protein [Vampirovibrionales bacterium]